MCMAGDRPAQCGGPFQVSKSCWKRPADPLARAEKQQFDLALRHPQGAWRPGWAGGYAKPGTRKIRQAGGPQQNQVLLIKTSNEFIASAVVRR